MSEATSKSTPPGEIACFTPGVNFFSEMEKLFKQLLKKIPIGTSEQIAGIIAGKTNLERTS